MRTRGRRGRRRAAPPSSGGRRRPARCPDCSSPRASRSRRWRRRGAGTAPGRYASAHGGRRRPPAPIRAESRGVVGQTARGTPRRTGSGARRTDRYRSGRGCPSTPRPAPPPGGVHRRAPGEPVRALPNPRGGAGALHRAASAPAATGPSRRTGRPAAATWPPRRGVRGRSAREPAPVRAPPRGGGPSLRRDGRRRGRRHPAGAGRQRAGRGTSARGRRRLGATAPGCTRRASAGRTTESGSGAKRKTWPDPAAAPVRAGRLLHICAHEAGIHRLRCRRPLGHGQEHAPSNERSPDLPCHDRRHVALTYLAHVGTLPEWRRSACGS